MLSVLQKGLDYLFMGSRISPLDRNQEFEERGDHWKSISSKFTIICKMVENTAWFVI